MQLIIVTTVLQLLHVDVTSIKTKMEFDQPPNVVNILVFCNHFMKYIIVYMTPNQAAKNCCCVSVARLHLDLWSSGQAPG